MRKILEVAENLPCRKFVQTSISNLLRRPIAKFYASLLRTNPNVPDSIVERMIIFHQI